MVVSQSRHSPLSRYMTAATCSSETLAEKVVSECCSNTLDNFFMQLGLLLVLVGLYLPPSSGNFLNIGTKSGNTLKINCFQNLFFTNSWIYIITFSTGHWAMSQGSLGSLSQTVWTPMAWVKITTCIRSSSCMVTWIYSYTSSSSLLLSVCYLNIKWITASQY